MLVFAAGADGAGDVPCLVAAGMACGAPGAVAEPRRGCAAPAGAAVGRRPLQEGGKGIMQAQCSNTKQAQATTSRLPRWGTCIGN